MSAPGGAVGMERRLGVLIVSEDPWRVDRWADWLEGAGFFTTSCPGPHNAWQCPRLDGERCALRELMDIAVVEIPATTTELYGGWAERSCAKVPDDQATVYVQAEGPQPAFTECQVHLSASVDRETLIEAATEAWSRASRPLVER